MIFYDVVLLLSLGLFVTVTFFWLRRPAASIYHPVTFYLIFHGLIFVIRPILSRIYDYRFVYMLYEFQPDEWTRILVILAANLSLLVFTFAGWRLASERVVFAQDRFDEIHRNLLVRPFLIVCVLLAPVAIYSVVETWLSSASDTGTMVIDAETRVRVNTQGNGYLLDAQLMLATLSVMFAWLFRFRLWSLLPFLAFFVLRAGTGGRGPFVIASVMMILLFLYERRRYWPEWRAAVLAVVVVAAFSFVVADRGASIRAQVLDDVTETYDSGYQFAPLEDMDFANMEYFEFVVNAVPERTGGYDYFASMLQIFTEPIPRSVWPGKPAGAPVRFFNLFDYGNPVGMTFSLPGYGWYELGWLGVVILTAGFAALFASFYRVMIRRGESNFALLFSTIMLATTVVVYRDGSIVSLMKMSLFYLLPLGLTALLAKAMGVPSAQTMRAAARSRESGGTDDVRPATPAERRRVLAAMPVAD